MRRAAASAAGLLLAATAWVVLMADRVEDGPTVPRAPVAAAGSSEGEPADGAAAGVHIESGTYEYDETFSTLVPGPDVTSRRIRRYHYDSSQPDRRRALISRQPPGGPETLVSDTVYAVRPEGVVVLSAESYFTGGTARFAPEESVLLRPADMRPGDHHEWRLMSDDERVAVAARFTYLRDDVADFHGGRRAVAVTRQVATYTVATHGGVWTLEVDTTSWIDRDANVPLWAHETQTFTGTDGTSRVTRLDRTLHSLVPAPFDPPDAPF